MENYYIYIYIAVPNVSKDLLISTRIAQIFDKSDLNVLYFAGLHRLYLYYEKLWYVFHFPTYFASEFLSESETRSESKVGLNIAWNF